MRDGDAFDAGFLRVRFACGGRLPPLRRTRGFLLLIGLRYKPGVRRSGGACAAMGHCVYGAMRHLIACFLRVRFVCGGLEAAATEKLGAPTTNQRFVSIPVFACICLFKNTSARVFGRRCSGGRTCSRLRWGLSRPSGSRARFRGSSRRCWKAPRASKTPGGRKR